MAAIMWLITIIAALAGAALWTDHSLPFAETLRWWAIGLAVLACPLFWRGRHGLLTWLPFGAKERLMAFIAGIFALPLVLPWPF